MSHYAKPRVLFFDIELAPMKGYFWSNRTDFIPLNDVTEHTSMLAWSAKWHGQKKIYYQDVSKQKNRRKDKKIVKALQEMINEADVIIGHCVQRFDKKKTNYRAIVNNLKPTLKAKVFDTYLVARKHFAFDSNKLSHLAKILGLDVQKYEHSKFPGNSLFIQCLEGNPEAWKEMRIYNPMDVIVLEQVYEKLLPWDDTLNFNLYHKMHDNICSCGSQSFTKNGFRTRAGGRYRRLVCNSCGKEHISPHNELSLDKRKAMLK